MTTQLAAAGPVELLVLQPTPFCNINCSYCYLPDRSSTKRMTVSTVLSAMRLITSSHFCGSKLSIVWHAGEPLALPISFYRDALSAISNEYRGPVEITNTIQTNGLLITEDWVDFIESQSIRVGLSIDGPAFIHDSQRVSREGRGTHRKAVEALKTLISRDLDPYVICVLTAKSLEYADEIFAFFMDLGVRRLCFNIEEAEGANAKSSLQTADSHARFERFMKRTFQLAAEHRQRIRVREFEQLWARICSDGDRSVRTGQQTTPFKIISVDVEGNFSTFSPELLGYKQFLLGNVASADLETIIQSERFKRINQEIQQGVEMCRASCGYFPVCGGGAPSNKWSENGSFASAETSYCRLKKQRSTDMFLAVLEDSLMAPPFVKDQEG